MGCKRNQELTRWYAYHAYIYGKLCVVHTKNDNGFMYIRTCRPSMALVNENLNH